MAGDFVELLLCSGCDPEEASLESARSDRTSDKNPEIVVGVVSVVSAACTAAAPLKHPAARRYKAHKDALIGRKYGTATTGGDKMQD